MSWIQRIEPEDWEGELAELKGRVTDPASGEIDNIMQIHALDPESLQAHLLLYQQAMKSTSGLPKVDREMIALVVSKANGCHY